MLNKPLKVFFILLVLFLVVGQGCETKDTSKDSSGSEKKSDTENPNDEQYDGLDDALEELDEIEDI